MPSYTQEDFEAVVCEECGRETGQFYIAESENERTALLCLDCLMGTETTEQRDFNEALESSRNWERKTNQNGLIILACIHCGEEHTEDWSEEDMSLATAFLEADVEHECEEEEEDVADDATATNTVSSEA